MAKAKVTVFLVPDSDGGYMAFAPFFPDCTTSGTTPADAFSAFQEALSLAIEDATPDQIEALELSHAPHVVIGEVEVSVPAQAGRKARAATGT